MLVFPRIGVPQNGWFILETPIKMDDLGVPLFSETSMCIKKTTTVTTTHILHGIHRFIWLWHSPPPRQRIYRSQIFSFRGFDRDQNGLENEFLDPFFWGEVNYEWTSMNHLFPILFWAFFPFSKQTLRSLVRQKRRFSWQSSLSWRLKYSWK